MKKKKGHAPNAQSEAEAATEAYVVQSSFDADPAGGYTGHPKDKDDKPVQDADDL